MAIQFRSELLAARSVVLKSDLSHAGRGKECGMGSSPHSESNAPTLGAGPERSPEAQLPNPEPEAAETTTEVAHAAAHHGHGSFAKLALGALGIVYGDIGTSPLYALKECVNGPHGLPPTDANILGLLSMMFWSVTLVVGVKYLGFIMRADNQGEGGILALLALLPRKRPPTPGTVGLFSGLVLFGAALLYGDGLITPAITVLSAVEGLAVATHALEGVAVPITVLILIAVFAGQHRGTHMIGRVFGPIMVVWFLTLAVLGIVAISKYPSVLTALSPIWALKLWFMDPVHAFVVLGSVVLCITGGEALYADMGHFGRRPIQAAWYCAVFPALILNYFGQGAVLLSSVPGAARAAIAENPFYALVPAGPAVYPLVLISTWASVIASQALISGAFSLTQQAVQLGYLPRVTVRHTSVETEGQVYVPEVNWSLAIGCIALVLAFGESSKLAAAYGIAVTGTMAITSLAFYRVTRERWNWPIWTALPLLVFFLIQDLAFFASNALKFFQGGFLPIALAFLTFMIMRTWKRGRALLGMHFAKAARPLQEFLEALHAADYLDVDGRRFPVVRVPGVAVFLTGNPLGTPPLLLHHLRHVKSLHATVVLVTVTTEHVPRVLENRIRFTALSDGFIRLEMRVGFMESPDVPQGLMAAISEFELPFTMDDVTYFLGRETLLATNEGEMSAKEEALFAFLSRNSQSATRYFGIPPRRVVEIGMQVDL
jgi:KUP system potassium uptake protein